MTSRGWSNWPSSRSRRWHRLNESVEWLGRLFENGVCPGEPQLSRAQTSRSIAEDKGSFADVRRQRCRCFQQSATTSAAGGGSGSAGPILPIQSTSNRIHSRGASRTGRDRSRGPCRSHRSHRHIHRTCGSCDHSRSCCHKSAPHSRSHSCGGGASGGGDHSRSRKSERHSHS